MCTRAPSTLSSGARLALMRACLRRRVKCGGRGSKRRDEDAVRCRCLKTCGALDSCFVAGDGLQHWRHAPALLAHCRLGVQKCGSVVCTACTERMRRERDRAWVEGARKRRAVCRVWLRRAETHGLLVAGTLHHHHRLRSPSPPTIYVLCDSLTHTPTLALSFAHGEQQTSCCHWCALCLSPH